MADRPPLRVLCVGLGAIGWAGAQRCLADPRFTLVAAVDPAHAGERLGDVEIAAQLPEHVDAEVALLAVGSTLAEIAELVTSLLALGVDVVSTCEELAHPWAADRATAAALDAAARAADRTAVGCGVNPGFVMDVVPVALAGACLDVRAIRVERSVDLTRRRPQLSAKMGVGLPVEDWLADRDRFGHHGLVESARLCAEGLGWEVTDVEFAREPLTRDGVVNGVRETARLQAQGDIELQLTFGLGEESFDTIAIDGDPPLRLRFDGGVAGDQATVARMLSTALVVGVAPAGLRLPLELPVAVR